MRLLSPAPLPRSPAAEAARTRVTAGLIQTPGSQPTSRIWRNWRKAGAHPWLVRIVRYGHRPHMSGAPAPHGRPADLSPTPPNPGPLESNSNRHQAAPP